MTSKPVHALSVAEHRHRLAFAERQHEHFRLRVLQAQMLAQVRLAKGDVAGAEAALNVARNYIEHVMTCNDTIDEHRRAIEPSEEGAHG